MTSTRFYFDDEYHQAKIVRVQQNLKPVKDRYEANLEILASEGMYALTNFYEPDSICWQIHIRYVQDVHRYYDLEDSEIKCLIAPDEYIGEVLWEHSQD